MADKPKVLCVSRENGNAGLSDQLRQSCEVVQVSSALQALARILREPFDGLCIASDDMGGALQLSQAMQEVRILDGLPDGVVLLDLEDTIVWANARIRQWLSSDDVAGSNFFAVLGEPEIMGPDFSPFQGSAASGQSTDSILRLPDHRYFHAYVAPILEGGDAPQHLVVTLREITKEMREQQKREAIHKAGIELADLTPDEVFRMQVDERIELLKSNILRHTQDLLNFNVAEIRLVDEKTGELIPLLSVGMDAEASRRPLFALPRDNGVTGYVAATGKSYVCENTAEDRLYIEGFKGAKSSLTVPLMFHNQVIGTFNVESPEPGAFTESDLQFLEIFSCDVASALNTLELMVAQKASAAHESVEAIHGAVALPVDEILNDAVNVLERYLGHEPEVVDRLQRILRNARDIKQVIHEVGQRMAPAEAVPTSSELDKHPKLRDCRILVVDADDRVRNDAHSLLERFGCDVETARSGDEATFMVRNTGVDAEYDVIIADIRLPDMSGYDLMVRLRDVLDPVPLVLMTGFGYDPGHSIVKARKAGLHPKAVLYKPFRLDQLVETVETMIDEACRVPQA